MHYDIIFQLPVYFSPTNIPKQDTRDVTLGTNLAQQNILSPNVTL